MSKRIEKDGKFYRIRRGKLVEIPLEWVGRCYNGKVGWDYNSRPYRRAEKSRNRNLAKEDLRGQLREQA